MGAGHDVVLGAGLAGLTAAYTLQQAGQHDWLVLEKEHEPGGHARTIDVDGYLFDFGPHILFTNDAEMEVLIRDLLGENMHAQERRAFIYHAAYDLYTWHIVRRSLSAEETVLVIAELARGVLEKGRK